MNFGKAAKEKKKTQSDQQDLMRNTQVSADKELRQVGVRKSHNSNLEEYDKVSPGPSQSVLRSSSSPLPRSKDLRVTFQQENPNSFPRTKSKQKASPLLWSTEKQSVLTPTRSTPEIGSLYLDSDTTEGTNKPWDMNFRDVVLSRTEMNHPLAEADTELESRTDRLLRLTRDLYEVTHLPDAAMELFEMRQEERSPKFQPCMNSLLQSDKQETRQTPKQQLKKQGIFPESPGSPVPGPAVQLYGPDVCTVLRSLLDLVDEHWSGQFSLHLNLNFMVKAILLLLPLTNPVPSPQPEDKKVGGNNDEQKGKQESRVWWDVEKSRRLKSRVVNEQCGDEEWESCGEQPPAFGVSEVRRLKRQLAKTQHEQEWLKTRLITALKENFILREEKMKIIASLKSDTRLLDLGEHLDRETQVLRQQNKLLKQLERTLHLLQDNHRSLVSHHDLLQKLIKRTSNSSKTL
ncbi:leucine-rich repeat-containing protein 36-like [Hemibagrus wyckioides]|uniref:leucine-rich repeat-containing protein 36-like n=1 Tax=Hemibagrus wyckioides TaxID=337641 RepID=UPI00266CA57F|nr:leucine-rich repeat-containing protein 36-like [Hemibagrus wyckioides]